MNNNMMLLTTANIIPIRKIVLGIPAQTFFSKYALIEKPTVEKLIKPIPTSNEITII